LVGAAYQPDAMQVVGGIRAADVVATHLVELALDLDSAVAVAGDGVAGPDRVAVRADVDVHALARVAVVHADAVAPDHVGVAVDAHAVADPTGAVAVHVVVLHEVADAGDDADAGAAVVQDLVAGDLVEAVAAAGPDRDAGLVACHQVVFEGLGTADHVGLATDNDAVAAVGAVGSAGGTANRVVLHQVDVAVHDDPLVDAEIDPVTSPLTGLRAADVVVVAQVHADADPVTGAGDGIAQGVAVHRVGIAGDADAVACAGDDQVADANEAGALDVALADGVAVGMRQDAAAVARGEAAGLSADLAAVDRDHVGIASNLDAGLVEV